MRDIGTGPAVIDAWDILDSSRDERHPARDYHPLTRDIYVAAGACGYVQVAARDPTAPAYRSLARAGRDHQPFAVDVLYSDIDETQHHIIRVALNSTPGGDHDGRVWSLNEVRHWTVNEPVPERHS